MVNIENQSIEEIVGTEAFFKIAESNNIDGQDVFKILKKACSTFRFSLSQDEMTTCCINALWKAVDKYQVDSKCKFTTYLYKGVVMECLSQKKFNKDKISFSGKIHPNI